MFVQSRAGCCQDPYSSLHCLPGRLKTCGTWLPLGVKALRNVTSSAVKVSESLETSDVKITSHSTLAMINKPLIASVIDELPSSLSKACGFVRIAGCEVHVLFDTCSSESFIHSRLVDWRKRKVWPSSETISMAASAFSTEIKGHACMYQGQEYTHVPLGV